MKRLLLFVLLAACEREERDFPEQVVPPVTVSPRSGLGMPSPLYAGEPPLVGADLDAAMPGYKETAYAVSQGQLLYLMFNCVGCHANGGGAMGPPLMDSRWLYGSTPADIATTIVLGRPNGMPSFRGKLVPAQLNALVAYVRALGGYVRGDAVGARTEHMQTTPPMELDEHGLPDRPGEASR
jgi:cytochrome c oxidase cbb3-type subunit 3